MNFIATRETQLGYVPVASIHQETPHDVRLPDDAAVDAIQAPLLRHGQAHPVALEALSDGSFRLLDGHRRFSAVRRIHADGGSWHKLLAHVYPSDLAPLDRFRMIRERNDVADRSFGLIDRGRHFAAFRKEGLCVATLARECGLTIAEVEDHLELADAPAPLAAQINRSSLNAVFAAMLARRYQAWRRSPHAALAEGVVARLLAHAAAEPVTIKSWRFLLDFYWSGDRPFMASDARTA